MFNEIKSDIRNKINEILNFSSENSYINLLKLIDIKENQEHINYFKNLKLELNNYNHSDKNNDYFRYNLITDKQNTSGLKDMYEIKDKNGNLFYMNCFYEMIYNKHIKELSLNIEMNKMYKGLSSKNTPYTMYADKNAINFSKDVIFASLSSENPIKECSIYLNFKKEKAKERLVNSLKNGLDIILKYNNDYENVQKIVNLFNGYDNYRYNEYILENKYPEVNNVVKKIENILKETDNLKKEKDFDIKLEKMVVELESLNNKPENKIKKRTKNKVK